ncbi:MAG: hypothetical protein WC310_01835 [Patescibacteria group bacterium]|jgi:predicted transposase YdaD
MPQLHEVFKRLEQNKKQRNEIKSVYRQELANSKTYQELLDKIKELRERKKKIEQDVKSELRGDLEKLSLMELDIKTDKEMLSDMALNQLVRGETIKVTDDYENEYEPIFSVRFRKIG